MKPGIEVIGVEVAAYAALAQRLAGAPVSVGGATIAEGIAVRDIGVRAAARSSERLVADVLVVPERAVEEAIALLAEGAKVVAEGAGAAGVAALLAFPERFAGKRVGVPICGGNIDARILANVLLRNLLRDGRLLRLMLEIPDRPGVLADIAGKIGDAGGNIIEVLHQRLFAAPSVQAAQLEVMFEVTRRRARGGHRSVAGTDLHRPTDLGSRRTSDRRWSARHALCLPQFTRNKVAPRRDNTHGVTRFVRVGLWMW